MLQQSKTAGARWRVIPVSLALTLFPASFSLGSDCGETQLTEREHRTVLEIQEFCRGVNGVKSGRDAICFVSRIDSESWNDFRKASFNITQKYLFIRSPGGYAPPAIHIANDVFFTRKTVIIDRNCLSACANYIFTAASRKVLLGNAVVSWHGSPETRYESDTEKPAARYQIDLHKDFLTLFPKESRPQIQRLMNEPPPGFKYRGEELQKHLWSYSDKQLCEDFGIKNIIRADPY